MDKIRKQSRLGSVCVRSGMARAMGGGCCGVWCGCLGGGGAAAVVVVAAAAAFAAAVSAAVAAAAAAIATGAGVAVVAGVAATVAAVVAYKSGRGGHVPLWLCCCLWWCWVG